MTCYSRAGRTADTASRIVPDLENDGLLRMKRPSLWRSVLSHHSTCAASPNSLHAAVCCSAGMTSGYASQKSLK